MPRITKQREKDPTPEEVEGAKNGDEGCWTQIFNKCYNRIHGTCSRMLNRKPEGSKNVDDLVQETFVKAFRKLHTFRGDSLFTTWLHQIAVNQVRMYFRSQKAENKDIGFESNWAPNNEIRRLNKIGCGQEILSGLSSQGGALGERSYQVISIQRPSSVVEKIDLENCIPLLPNGYRTVLIMHDVGGLKHEEIAIILGCSVGTSKSQLHKARVKLRGLLVGYRVNQSSLS